MHLLQRTVREPWFAHVSPFAVFILLTALGALWPSAAHVGYILKTIAVGLMLVALRHRYPEMRWKTGIANWVIGVILGIAVLVIWVAPEKMASFIRIGNSTGFNPYAFGWSGAATWALIGVRLLGASIVVPVMEELFWRSFLMRVLIHGDFQRVPVGTYRAFSFLLVAIIFGIEHDRWAVGIAAGLIYGGLLVWRKDLFTCMIAHAVTNLGLGIYVLKTQQWSFW